MTPTDRTRWISEHARAVGFDLCGVVPLGANLFASTSSKSSSAGPPFKELSHLSEWLARGYAGEMKYLHDPKRADPQRVLEGAKSLIVAALNYNAPHPRSSAFDSRGGTSAQSDAEDGPPRGWISRYAWGNDYHEVVDRKLSTLLAEMRAKFREPFEARTYVDTGPILERVAAKYAGIGWLGKNSCLINQHWGSWLFLGVIITTLPLDPTLAPAQSPPADLCGTCTRCLDACPTQAFPEPYVLDSRRCISYLTIELRGEIPEKYRPAVGHHVFGCDICQDVCPWNKKAPVTQLADFQPRDQLFAPDLEWLASLSQAEFSRTFRKSAVKRAKWRGLLRNTCVALGNSSLPRGSAAYLRAVRLLERLGASDDSMIAGHARWALTQLSGESTVDARRD